MKENNNVRYGFIGKTSHNADVFKKDLLKKLFEHTPYDRLLFMMQIHSNNVEVVDVRNEYADTDALIANAKNVVLTGTFADCAPIYFYVKNTNIVALAHSGWKGTKLEISKRVLDILLHQFHVDKNDIYVEIGPCISVESYEVKEDFLPNFNAKYFIKKDEKIYFDLKQYNYDIIKSVVPESNITIDPRCTYKELNLHSYRREKEKSGRNIAFIYSV